MGQETHCGLEAGESTSPKWTKTQVESFCWRAGLRYGNHSGFISNKENFPTTCQSHEVIFLGSSLWEPGGSPKSKVHEGESDPLKAEIPGVSHSLTDAAAAKSPQLCLTLCEPIDSSPPGAPVPGILQAKTLEWVAISFSNAWKWKVKVKLLSGVRLFETPWTAAYQAPPSMGFSRQEYWRGVSLPSPILLLVHTQLLKFVRITTKVLLSASGSSDSHSREVHLSDLTIYPDFGVVTCPAT